MRPKIYALIERCVEEAVPAGINRAYKRNNDPTREDVAREVSEGVMAEIAEWFAFEEFAE